MKEVLERGTPILKAVRPFSAKQKSKREVTGTEGVLSCSCCLARLEPLTWPIAHLWRRWERRECISGETAWTEVLHGTSGTS